jgi:hypothetical protein
MRAAILVAVLWTAVVAGVVLATPSLVSAPPCSALVDPPAGCAVLDAAADDLVWRTQTRPILVLSIAGYVAIGILAAASRRRA